MKAEWKDGKMYIELDGIEHILTPEEAYQFYSICKKAVEEEFFRKVLELNNKYKVKE